MPKILLALLKPLYEILIKKGLDFIKEVMKRSEEKQDVKECLDIEDPKKRNVCVRDELND
jgi:hypothetical protein